MAADALTTQAEEMLAEYEARRAARAEQAAALGIGARRLNRGERRRIVRVSVGFVTERRVRPAPCGRPRSAPRSRRPRARARSRSPGRQQSDDDHHHRVARASGRVSVPGGRR